jgi:hypothetical protein
MTQAPSYPWGLLHRHFLNMVAVLLHCTALQILYRYSTLLLLKLKGLEDNEALLLKLKGLGDSEAPSQDLVVKHRQIPSQEAGNREQLLRRFRGQPGFERLRVTTRNPAWQIDMRIQRRRCLQTSHHSN